MGGNFGEKELKKIKSVPRHKSQLSCCFFLTHGPWHIEMARGGQSREWKTSQEKEMDLKFQERKSSMFYGEINRSRRCWIKTTYKRPYIVYVFFY